MNVTCVCNRLLKIPDGLAGKKVRCPGCRQILTAPAAAPEPPPLMAELVEPPASPIKPGRATPRRSAAPPLPYEPTDAAPMALSNRPPHDLNFDEDDRDSNRDSNRDDDDRISRTRRKRLPRPSMSGGGSGAAAGVLGGLAMMVIAVVWFVAGLAGDIIFFYPPILFVLGIVAVIKGIVSGGR